jgi:hypothetical protein
MQGWQFSAGIVLLSFLGTQSVNAASPGCGILMPRKDQIVASGPVGYQTRGSVSDGSVADDLRAVFVRLIKLDKDLKGFSVGAVEVSAGIEKRPDKTINVTGESSHFKLVRDGALSEKTRIVVCGTPGSRFIIAVDDGLKPQQMYIGNVAQRFLKGEKIKVAGVKVWPNKGTQQ